MADESAFFVCRNSTLSKNFLRSRSSRASSQDPSSFSNSSRSMQHSPIHPMSFMTVSISLVLDPSLTDGFVSMLLCFSDWRTRWMIILLCIRTATTTPASIILPEHKRRTCQHLISQFYEARYLTPNFRIVECLALHLLKELTKIRMLQCFLRIGTHRPVRVVIVFECVIHQFLPFLDGSGRDE